MGYLNISGILSLVGYFDTLVGYFEWGILTISGVMYQWGILILDGVFVCGVIGLLVG